MKSNLKLFGAVLGVATFCIANVALAQTDALTKEDKEFLKNASEMGITEIELGKLAQDRAFSPEVKALGVKLVADHAKANSDLILLVQKKGVELKMDATITQKNMLAAFEGKTGAAFDREFREHVAKDHEKAIKTFADAAKDAKDIDVKAFALQNLPVLKEHHLMVGGKQN